MRRPGFRFGSGIGAWKGPLLSFLLFGGVGLILVVAAPALGLRNAEAIERLMAAARGPWALPAVVIAFAGLAFIGVPQIALIAAAVVILGPERGALYSWIGTMVSASLGFAFGRVFGLKVVSPTQGPRVKRFMASLGKNGFVASLLVRLAPFAPFVLINMAAGVTPMAVVDFLAGTGIGIIPKIVLTAFAGGSTLRALHGAGPWAVVVAILAALLLIAAGLLARRWVRRRRTREPPPGLGIPSPGGERKGPAPQAWEGEG
ncbi:MAG TPA: TVP38/TMEM64 family protein [Caulobacteraceae bacterium]